MSFQLHPNLATKSPIIDLPLCSVLLEDNQYYPWIFLVPRRENISKIMDLNSNDQLELIKEIDLAQKILWDTFKPSQLNVAAIGNKTSQLHIHVIARKSNDPAWPGTVWDHGSTLPYPKEHKERMIQLLAIDFQNSLKAPSYHY